MGLSAVIAALGLIADSVAVVIGAMLVAPLLTPIMAFAASLVLGSSRRQLTSALQVAVFSGQAVLVAWAVAAVVPAFRTIVVGQELLVRTQPRLIDLAIALAAGTAGAYVTVHKRIASALPGVAVAVALIPPLAAIGVTLELGRTDLASQATLLFATNLIAIVASATLVFILTGFVGRVGPNGRGMRMGLVTTVVAAMAVAYPLFLQSRAVIVRSDRDQFVSQAVAEWLGDVELQVSAVSIDNQREQTLVALVVEGATPPPSAKQLADLLVDRINRPVVVRVRWTQQRQESAGARPLAD
jgi:uncharacterized hydrophobic protein (TIGR00271 family)